MQSLNVLIAGDGIFLDKVKSSKFLNKLYITSDKEYDGVLNIKFNTFKELAKKCRALQIDLVIVENEKWILQGIGDILKKNFINSTALDARWTNLALSYDFARELLKKYDIAIPKKLLLPTQYPVLIKGNGILKKANSMQEIISIKQNINKQSEEIAKTVYIEEYIDGKKYSVMSLFDGKNLLTFPNENIEDKLLKEYSKKLEKMLVDQKAKFVGFINSEIIQFEGKIYNTGFNFKFSKPACDWDLLYVLVLALYQKLDEISTNY